MADLNSKANGKPAMEKLPPMAALLLSGIANLKYAITGKTASGNPSPSAEPPPMAALLLSGLANLRYAITGQTEKPKKQRP